MLAALTACMAAQIISVAEGVSGFSNEGVLTVLVSMCIFNHFEVLGFFSPLGFVFSFEANISTCPYFFRHSIKALFVVAAGLQNTGGLGELTKNQNVAI